MATKTLNLGRKTLRIGYNNDLPYTDITTSAEDIPSLSTGRPVVSVDGIEALLVQLMARHYNFTIDFINCHKQYGVQLPNGTWSGMMGQLIAGQLDLGIGGISMTYDRALVVGWLAPYWIDQFTYAIGVDKHQSLMRFDLLYRPLTAAVWLAILASFAMLMVFARFYRNFRSTSAVAANDEPDVIWFSVATLLRQSQPLWRSLPLSAKVVTIVWITMTSVVLLNIYAANLCSLLTIPPSSLVDTLDKLAAACENGEIIPLASANTSIFPALARSQKPASQTILQWIQPCKNHVHGVEMIVQNGPRYAMISSRERLIVSRIIHDFYMPSDDSWDASFFPMFTSIPIRPQLAPLLRKPFEEFVTRMVNAGLVAYWKQNIMLKVSRQMKHQNQPLNDHIDDGFNLRHLAAIFFLYLALSGVAFLVFLSELWFSARSRGKKISPTSPKMFRINVF